MSEKNIFKDLYGSIATAKEVGISIRQLYHWVDDIHVVRPHLWQHGQRKFRRFDSQDVARLRAMKKKVDEGYTLTAAVKMVNGSGEVAT